MKFKLLLVALALPVAVVAGEVSYTNTSASIFAKPDSGFLGQVPIATKVEVLKTEGDKCLVKVSGWALTDYPSQIFQGPGLRIEMASFDEEDAVKLDPAAGKEEVQGNDYAYKNVIPCCALYVTTALYGFPQLSV